MTNGGQDTFSVEVLTLRLEQETARAERAMESNIQLLLMHEAAISRAEKAERERDELRALVFAAHDALEGKP